MSESLFNIFGDRLNEDSTISARNLPRHTLPGNENIGKLGSTAPIKPNEPIKKCADTKKSFLSNTGKVVLDIQTPTPAQQVYSPRSKNVQSSGMKVLNSELIYSDELDDDAKKFYEELEFTKPVYKLDNYHKDVLDYLFEQDVRPVSSTCPRTPPPLLTNHSMEFISEDEDDFFTDNFGNVSNPCLFGEDDIPCVFID